MTDIKTMQAELAALDEQAAELAKRRNELRQRIADAQAAFKVGDRVTYEGANCVWEVARITPSRYRSDGPSYFGAKLKKDGTPSKVVNEIWVPWGKSLRAA